jgi:hypothetical protein
MRTALLLIVGLVCGIALVRPGHTQWTPPAGDDPFVGVDRHSLDWVSRALLAKLRERMK